MAGPAPLRPLSEAEFQALSLAEREAYVKRVLEDLDARIQAFESQEAADPLLSLGNEPA